MNATASLPEPDPAQFLKIAAQGAGDTGIPLRAVLRRVSPDELPQFIDVLQGRMSTIGTRPKF